MDKTRERPAPAKDGEPPETAPSAAEAATRVHASPTRCPWCHDSCAPEDTSAVVCQRCLSRHHAPCWREGGRCASCQGTTALGAVSTPREVAPAELALLRQNRVGEAVQRIARRLSCHESEAARLMLDAAARELATRDDAQLGAFAKTIIAISGILAAMIVLVVFLNVLPGK